MTRFKGRLNKPFIVYSSFTTLGLLLYSGVCVVSCGSSRIPTADSSTQNKRLQNQLFQFIVYHLLVIKLNSTNLSIADIICVKLD